VAIVQISRITNRKGLTENLPQLAGAELGWCIDSRRLFIGNGTLEDGAPVIGNTEILTEFSDITVLSDYTYEDIIVGYAPQTGPSASEPTVRTVQAKLDDFANVRDFGAVGDGQTDDTAAINRALYQLYCVQPTTAVRRTLYFPAGTYLVSDSIIIPTYAKLQGEGANCSIIELYSGTSTYVAQYGDSLQQTGANIGNNGATTPQNIEISSMTFRSLENTDVFLVDSATQCYFDSVNFEGTYTNTQLINNTASIITANIAGVRFESQGGAVCNDITFDKCGFSGLTFGVNTTAAVTGITISNSKFHSLYQGLVLDGGNPTGFRAVHNQFDSIYAEGIVYADCNLNVSAYNLFLNVGNSIGGGTPTSAVITFECDNNISVGDLFARDDSDALLQPRIDMQSSANAGGTGIQLGRYARDNGRTFTLANNQSNQPIFEINSQQVRAFTMNYTITRDIGVRTGVLTVVTGPSDDSSVTTAYADDYTENTDTGITLSSVEASEIVTVRYSSTNTGISGILTYSISHLA
jgi:hypothetical protein